VLSAALVLLVGAWTLVHDSLGGPRSTSRALRPQTRAAATGAFGYFTCLQAMLDREVPHGATVLAVAKDDATYQRLVELATPWARVTANPSAAQLTLRLAPAGTAAGCGGTQVVVETK
jgi:hypothetical protein